MKRKKKKFDDYDVRISQTSQKYGMEHSYQVESTEDSGVVNMGFFTSKMSSLELVEISIQLKPHVAREIALYLLACAEKADKKSLYFNGKRYDEVMR